MRLSIYTALLGLAVLLCGGTAQASPFGPAEETAYAEAVAYWGKTPACSSVSKETVPLGSLDWGSGEEVLGRATLGVPSSPPPCGIWVVAGLEPVALCSVIRHEYGHLLGYEHNDPELAQMPGCGAEEDPSSRQGWEEWRELAATCREARRGGPKRSRCWKAARRLANEVRSGRY